MTTLSSEAERLADWLQANVNIYPQVSEDEPGGYATEFDQKVDEAAALLRRIPELEAAFDRIRAAEHKLSESYVRIREAIGAMHPPSLEAEELWSYVEKTARDLASERDQLRAELEKVRWQPIETAPKWQSVLLWATRTGGRCVIDYWGDYDRHNHPRITHWMPLPAAPTPPNADQKGQ